jgi:isoleucyl-tRNA synthetase
VRAALDTYAPDRAAKAIERFTIDELSNWYIRRNRRRFWKSENDADKAAAYQTLYEVLTTLARVLAPFIPFVAEAIYQNLVPSVDASAPESVHLTDYPAADRSKIDELLSRDMAAVLEIVGAGRAARQEAAVKVRQPLPALLIHSRDGAVLDAVSRLSDLIADELNVKSVQSLPDPRRFVSYDIRPNLRALGPRFGKRLGAVREALAAVDVADVAAKVESGQPVELVVENETVTLAPDEILVDLVKLPGFAAAQGARATVVLDTSLTPELIEEGFARDFVRGIQDARKQAGFRIEESIVIEFLADPEVSAAVDAHRGYVMTETLAVALDGVAEAGVSDAVEPEAVEGPGGRLTSDGRYLDQIEVGDHQVRIVLRPVAALTA